MLLKLHKQKYQETCWNVAIPVFFFFYCCCNDKVSTSSLNSLGFSFVFCCFKKRKKVQRKHFIKLASFLLRNPHSLRFIRTQTGLVFVFKDLLAVFFLGSKEIKYLGRKLTRILFPSEFI